jgi:hypothetical protein
MRLAAAVLAALLANASSALACACCSNEGHRQVASAAFDSGKREEIASLRFARTASLFTGEADVDAIEGIATPAPSYDLAVTRRDGRIDFAFRGSRGRGGTLSLAEPKSVAIFEVDPRNHPDRGRGPNLYKEWTLSGPAAGSGIFRRGVRPRATLSLILHGAGNNCTSASDFSHWTLAVTGPQARYMLIGALVTAR